MSRFKEGSKKDRHTLLAANFQSIHHEYMALYQGYHYPQIYNNPVVDNQDYHIYKS